MKHLIPQTMTAVSVLALALAVGGCGSSSDKDMGTGPTAPEMAAAEKMACTDAGGVVRNRWDLHNCCRADRGSGGSSSSGSDGEGMHGWGRQARDRWVVHICC